jgi:hypothetical protein
MNYLLLNKYMANTVTYCHHCKGLFPKHEAVRSSSEDDTESTSNEYFSCARCNCTCQRCSSCNVRPTERYCGYYLDEYYYCDDQDAICKSPVCTTCNSKFVPATESETERCYEHRFHKCGGCQELREEVFRCDQKHLTCGHCRVSDPYYNQDIASSVKDYVGTIYCKKCVIPTQSPFT